MKTESLKTEEDLTRLDPTLRNADPIAKFQEWFKQAQEKEEKLPESVALATATPNGRPSIRIILFKGVVDDGFRFFTNYESRKARELDANPFAALAFYWPRLHRQIRVEGPVKKLSREESEIYFKLRPRGSQLGAWASSQSSPVSNRDVLVESFTQFESKFRDSEVPCPPFWGGYTLIAEEIEFWTGLENRLHDRVKFTRSSGELKWRSEILGP